MVDRLRSPYAGRKNPTKATTIQLKLDSDMRHRLDQLAAVTKRTPDSLAQQAIRDFLDVNERAAHAIQEALGKADQPGAKFIDHEEVDTWPASWGRAHEDKPPE